MQKEVTEKPQQDTQFILLVVLLLALLVPYFITIPVYLGMQIYYKNKNDIQKLHRIWLVTFVYGLVGIIFNVFIGIFLFLILEQLSIIMLIPIGIITILSVLVTINAWKYRNPTQ